MSPEFMNAMPLEYAPEECYRIGGYDKNHGVFENPAENLSRLLLRFEKLTACQSIK